MNLKFQDRNENLVAGCEMEHSGGALRGSPRSEGLDRNSQDADHFRPALLHLGQQFVAAYTRHALVADQDGRFFRFEQLQGFSAEGGGDYSKFICLCEQAADRLFVVYDQNAEKISHGHRSQLSVAAMMLVHSGIRFC